MAESSAAALHLCAVPGMVIGRWMLAAFGCLCVPGVSCHAGRIAARLLADPLNKDWQGKAMSNACAGRYLLVLDVSCHAGRIAACCWQHCGRKFLDRVVSCACAGRYLEGDEVPGNALHTATWLLAIPQLYVLHPNSLMGLQVRLSLHNRWDIHIQIASARHMPCMRKRERGCGGRCS